MYLQGIAAEAFLRDGTEFLRHPWRLQPALVTLPVQFYGLTTTTSTRRQGWKPGSSIQKQSAKIEPAVPPVKLLSQDTVLDQDTILPLQLTMVKLDPKPGFDHN